MIRSLPATLTLLGLLVCSALVVQPPLGRTVQRRSHSASRANLLPGQQRRTAPHMSLSASATPSPIAAAIGSVSRRLTTLLSAMLTFICFAVRAAVAMETTVRSPAATAASLVFSADVLKWGGLGAAFGVAYMFRSKEGPHERWTVNSEPDAIHDSPVEGPPAANSAAKFEEAATDPDLSLMSDLQKRMMELAEERLKAEDAASDTPPPADDSSDEWGTGNTAVLEPPKPPAEPDLDSVAFPEGFPLRDVDHDEPTFEADPDDIVPAADADKIAMLNRMMGLE